MATPSTSSAARLFLKHTSQLRWQTLPRFQNPLISRQHARRLFHSSGRFGVVKPFLLADVGEGITEVQIVQWYVQPGARVAQFDKICDVVSDKASVEITSRFDGVIKKLHYEADDIAKVGKPLVDIDIESEITPELEALTETPEAKETGIGQPPDPTRPTTRKSWNDGEIKMPTMQQSTTSGTQRHATFATPAVRHLTKELNLNIEDIPGTGKDGRVLKEDVQKYASVKSDSVPAAPPQPPVESLGEDRTVPLNPVQSRMFKAMTRSLQIPHFLYTDSINFTELNLVRRALNAQHSSLPDSPHHHQPKLSALPFILKSVSLALTAFPSLNAHLDTESDPQKPKLTHKAAHNIGVAVDTPQGLLVPVVRNVQSHSILSLATELQRLSALARDNKLSTSDLSGGTFTVSNIGSLGGGVVAPIIVSPQVAILGVGRSKKVPAFDEKGQVVKRDEAMFSWSADHRVVDGAMMARFAESVKAYLERVESMMVRLR